MRTPSRSPFRTWRETRGLDSGPAGGDPPGYGHCLEVHPGIGVPGAAGAGSGWDRTGQGSHENRPFQLTEIMHMEMLLIEYNCAPLPSLRSFHQMHARTGAYMPAEIPIFAH